MENLKTKTKCSFNTKGAGIRVLQIITSEIKVNSENLEDIPNTKRVLPINLVGRSYQWDIRWAAQCNIFIR